MDGLLWISAIWGLTLAALYRLYVRRIGYWPLSPILVLSLFLLLLGIESTSTPSVTNTIGLNTVIRGFLASASLVFAIRVLLVNSSQGRIRSAGRRTNLTLLFAYAAFAAFSTMYSASAIQTLGKAYELGAGVIVVWAIATSPKAKAQVRAAIDLIVILWAAMLVVAIPGFFLLPSQFVLQTEGRPGFVYTSTMGAPYAHSNGLSAIGAMIAAYAIARALRERAHLARRLWFALGTTSSIGILLASGRQGVIIWAISVGVVLFLYARPAFIFALLPTIVFAVNHWSAQLWKALSRDQQESTLYTLSSRLTWWDAAIATWRESPLIGYGFGAGGRFVALPSIGQGGVGSLHSGYFEALVGVGLIGFAPLIMVVGRVARWSWIRLRRGVEPHLSILIVPLALHTAISLGFAAWLTSQFIVLALLASCADFEPEPHRFRRDLASGRHTGRSAAKPQPPQQRPSPEASGRPRDVPVLRAQGGNPIR